MEEIGLKNKKALDKALYYLKQGKVIICPTDTIYGFLADAFNKKAVQKIFRLKKRSLKKPIALFVKDIKTASKLAFLKDESIFSKKKTTYILKARKNISLLVSEKGGIGLRIPDSKFLRILLTRHKKPLAQTSVNISENISLSNAESIKDVFGRQDILFINGGSVKRKASRVIDLTENRILRY